MIELGQNFGKYRLIDRLAVGGMAEIFKAAVPGNDGRDRIVAIKRLHRNICDDAELTRMLVDEARISVLLNHPNIAQIFDLGSIDGQFFIVMAFIEGVDTHEILEEMRRRREFIPVPAALHILADTCKALHYAHNQVGPDQQPLNIVHRDVSPQNIMVTYDGDIKLVDFGIAKAAKRVQTTQAGVIKGKFYYMAPEQAHGNFVDGRSDVFSAGMVLYEMLTARSPYDDVSDAELLRAVRMANIPPPSQFRPDLDPELDRIVMMAVQKDPMRRFQSAQEMRYAIDEYARRVYPPVNHQEQMAHFVANLFGRPLPPDIGQMQRDEFSASSESMIFDRPDLSAIQDFRAHRDFAQNQTVDHDPTMVWDSESVKDRLESFDPYSGAPPTESVQGTHADLPSHRLPPSPAHFSPAIGPSATASTESTSVMDALSKPVVIYGAIALAVLLVGVLAAVILSGDDEPSSTIEIRPSPAIAVDSNGVIHLALNSTPGNAVVTVNGEEKGSTPLSVPLEVGKSYALEIGRAGFETWKKDLEVTADTKPVEVELAEAQGVMKISSYPPGAQILIDGKKVGAAPYSHAGLQSGKTYKVEATLGEKHEKREITWKRGEEPAIDIMFELEKPPVEDVVALENVESDEKATASAAPAVARSTKSKPAKSSDEDLDIWGGSKKKKTAKKTTKKAEPKAKAEDEDLDIWGGSKKKKKKPAKKTKKKKKKEEEGLDIW